MQHGADQLGLRYVPCLQSNKLHCSLFSNLYALCTATTWDLFGSSLLSMEAYVSSMNAQCKHAWNCHLADGTAIWVGCNRVGSIL